MTPDDLSLRLARLKKSEGPELAWDSREVQNLATLYGVRVSLPSHEHGLAPRLFVGTTWFWVRKEWSLAHWREAIIHHGMLPS